MWKLKHAVSLVFVSFVSSCVSPLVWDHHGREGKADRKEMDGWLMIEIHTMAMYTCYEW